MKAIRGATKHNKMNMTTSTIKPAPAPEEPPPPSGGGTMITVVVTAVPSTVTSLKLFTSSSVRLSENPASLKPVRTASSKSAKVKANKDCTTLSIEMVEPSGMVVTKTMRVFGPEAVKRRAAPGWYASRRLLINVAVQTT